MASYCHLFLREKLVFENVLRGKLFKPNRVNRALIMVQAWLFKIKTSSNYKSLR